MKSDLPDRLKQDDDLRYYLESLITKERLQKFDRILKKRTQYVTVVLENLVEEHNSNAVLRSCECLGVQDVYIISDNRAFKPARKVLQGSHKWLNVYKYDQQQHDNTRNCIRDLRNKGYKIAVTSLTHNAIELDELSTTHPLAFVFGRESTGVTHHMAEHADVYVKIPMSGFTNSLNISVSAGICLYSFLSKMKLNGISANLSNEERHHIRCQWILNSIKEYRSIVEHYDNRLK